MIQDAVGKINWTVDDEKQAVVVGLVRLSLLCAEKETATF